MGILIMKDYLAIIRKVDFIDLFKYGHFSISYAVPFDGDMSLHANDMELFNRLTSKMNMYEYSFEYLVIHFKANDNNEQYISIDIRDVCALYTFDQEAKKEMSISFDSRIQLHVSPWTDKFNELQRDLSIKQSLRGIDNLWTIFNLPDEDIERCKELITPSIVQEVFRELYNYERPIGEQSIWTYLLRYERHSFYPKGMIGYFCDFIHVFCNYSKKQELGGEVAETTQLFHLIVKCKEAKFHQLITIVESSPLYKLTEDVAGCRFAVVAPLFLYLRAEFADGMEHKPDDNFIEYTKKIGDFECSVAIYLLGLSLGFDKTYDAFYESAKLSFFKKSTQTTIPPDLANSKEISDIKEVVGDDKNHFKVFREDSNNHEETEHSLENAPMDCENNGSESQGKHLPIVWMRNKKKDVRPVFSDDEKENLIKLGYTYVKKLNDTVMKAIEGWGYNPEQEKRRFSKSKK